MLGLGASLNGSQIKEGDDVYFECRVRFVTFPWWAHWLQRQRQRGPQCLLLYFCLLDTSQLFKCKNILFIRANPRAYKISWRCNVSNLLSCNIGLALGGLYAVSKVNVSQWRKPAERYLCHNSCICGHKNGLFCKIAQEMLIALTNIWFDARKDFCRSHWQIGFYLVR